MKFTKTLLAASVAIAAVSTVNAAVVVQEAKPVQVTENLVNNKFVTTGDRNSLITGYEFAPVHSELATTYNTNTQGNNKITSDYLPTLNLLNNKQGDIVGVDLGSQQVTGATGRDDYKYDVFKYTQSNGTTVYRLQQVESQKYVPGTFSLVNGVLVANNTVSAEAIENTSIWTLERGGQLTGTDFTTNTGYETKVVNGEHVLYGYQGQTGQISGTANGNVVTPTANNQPVSATFDGAQGGVSNDIRYVQSGIIANTGDYINGTNGADPYLDPSKNIYGVSARDNNNVVMMTGNGIALADLSNGILQTDGSVITKNTSGATSVAQKARSYSVGGKTIVEVYNDVAGNDFETQWFEVSANNQLVAYDGAKPAVGTHVKTGTANFTTGTVNSAVVHNTVTNKNVTYKETVEKRNEDRIDASVTTSTGADTQKFEKQNSGVVVSKTEQYVSTGVIGEANNENVYGTEVVKSVTADGKTTTSKTTITANYVDSGDFRINGVSIVDNVKTSVDEAVGNATAVIDAKIVEVDSRLTAFNSTATALNTRVDQLNSRINDVKETAYSGVAIALAAQQQVPNIGAGQVAIFGGAGHYEGETAGALGLVGVLADGRTSLSGALGVGGSGDIGGRVGVAYVFGGK